MKRLLIAVFVLSALIGTAQTYPFVDAFETYTNFTTLGTQGGYSSDMSVYQTHGMGSSKGLISQISTFNTRDTTVSPLIGPITATSRVSFYYRIVDQSLYPATATTLGTNDKVEIFAGSQAINFYQSIYSITSANHMSSTTFKKVTIPVGSLAGQSGNLKIVVTKGSATDYFVDIDSLVVMDSTTAVGALAVSGVKTDVTCFGLCNGNIGLNVSGGTQPYTYSWSNSLPATSTQLNLCAGTYQVTVTDNSSASATASFTITQPTQINLSETHTNVSCFGGVTGCINVTTAGGSPAYTYSWNNGTTTEDICNIAAGSYTLTVTDANNCTANLQVTLTQPSALNLNISATDATCFGSASGCISLSLSGGTPAYHYAWSNSGPDTSQICGLVAGTYSLTATDANQCTITSATTISQPTQVNITAQATNPQTPSSNDGSIVLSITGSSTPYGVSLNGATATSDTAYNSLGVGCYIFNVQDALGCSAEVDTVCLTAPTSVNTNSNTSLSVFPNPASDYLTIITGFNSAYEVSVFNTRGQLVKQAKANTASYILDIRDLTAASYILQVKTDEGVTQRTFTVTH